MPLNQASFKYQKSMVAVALVLITNFSAFSAVFNFYGHYERTQSDWRYVQGIDNNRLDYKRIKTWVNQINRTFQVTLIRELQLISLKRDLDDLGTVLLVRHYADQVYANRNSAKLLQWKVLKELGYDVLLSYNSQGLDVFGRLPVDPASSVYFYYKGKRYTNLDFHESRIVGSRYIFSDSYQPNRKALFFNASKSPKIGARSSRRKLAFEYGGKYYHLEARTNQSLVDYLDDLPRLSLGTGYVRREISTQAQESIIEPLKNYASELNPNQRAPFLLKFVQQAFRYKTDFENYGYEKYNYPEETLNASFVDCEDKSLLLAFLYKEILNVSSVLLVFHEKKHVSLGVALPGYNNAYSFKYQGENYVSCEPTGVNYPVGRSAIALAEVDEVIRLY